MKSIQVPFTFLPDPIGGTEVYVASLARHLRTSGGEVIVAAPGPSDAEYTVDDLPVQRFRVGDDLDLRGLYGEGDAAAASSFGRILERERPDVVHLHAFTAAVSLRLVQEARRREIPVVFTYHTPTVSCQRGTLMRWGREICDGRLDLTCCTQCALQGLGLPQPVARAAGRFPVRAGKSLGAAGLSGGPWTALRMRELVDLRQTSFRALMADVDRVVAVSQWVKDLLVRNGVTAEKITLSRHGLDLTPAAGGRAVNTESPPDSPLRVVYLGRLDPVKGVHLLIRALRSMPEAWIELHVFGVVQGAAGTEYAQTLHELAADDPRIVFRPAIRSEESIGLLRSVDVLAVPSQWLETGPLVVLEAFAAGIAVVGSNLGGIAELVEHEVNGLLVETDSLEAWSQTLWRLSHDRALLAKLRAGVRRPRDMREVAEEMLDIYRALLWTGRWSREAARQPVPEPPMPRV